MSVLANDSTQFLAHAVVGFRNLLTSVKQMLRLNTKPLTSICRWSALLPSHL